MLISVIVAFFGLLIIGVPIAHVVLGAAGIGCLMTGTTGTILAQQTVLGMNSYVMLAVPFFILSGDLAAKGQTSQRLVNAINAFLGHLPGGLGIATIFACAIFGAITGSSIACVVAIGALMLPKLKENGYPLLLSLGIITTGGTLGVMIPPSIPMLQIAIAMGTSVGKQFTAGFIPGILTAAIMSAYVVIYAKRTGIPRTSRIPFRQRMLVLKDSFWALMFPVIVLGSIYGGISGYFGGTLDIIMMRLLEIINGIPYLIIVILLMMILRPGMMTIIIAYSLVGWIPMARLVRGQVVALKQQEYIAAAEAMGAGPARIIARHLLPNTLSVVIVRVTLSIPSAIFSEAYLSYIGLGIPLPMCSWGSLAQLGIENFRIYPYQLIIPAICISLTMLAFNMFGDGLRDAFDPRLRR